jgi:hypothetical protein
MKVNRGVMMNPFASLLRDNAIALRNKLRHEIIEQERLESEKMLDRMEARDVAGIVPGDYKTEVNQEDLK